MDATERAAALVGGDTTVLAHAARHDPDPRVRAVALAETVRRGPRATAREVWRDAARDTDAKVRLRAAQCAPRLGRSATSAELTALLDDADPLVAEAAAFAAGEHPRPGTRLLAAVTVAATGHPDALVREAAVAALGSIGDPASLPAVLAACDDKPAVRRRAVIALAAFEGDAVERRLAAALHDRDWQVRQAAEDLLHVGGAPGIPE